MLKLGQLLASLQAHIQLNQKSLKLKMPMKRCRTEMDMVIDIGALRSGEYDKVQKDIEAVVQASPAIVKVILNYF